MGQSSTRPRVCRRRPGRPSLAAFVAVASAMLAPFTAAESADDLPQWHPLRPDRVADARNAPPPTMSQHFYNRLSRVHALLDENSPEEGLALLDRVRPDRIGKYEAAQLYQTYGYIYSAVEREDDAFVAFEKSLELDMLPTHQQQRIRYMVAGYHAGNERYEESNAVLMSWFRFEPVPSAEAYVVMGANFAQRQMMAEALPYVLRANKLATEPSQNWRNLQLAIHLELDQFADAIDLLKDNIGIWPDSVRNYVALSRLYAETGDHEGALAALSIPWQRGILLAREDILSLVRFNLLRENPARGAMILSEAMKRGQVDENPVNLRLLLNAWIMARENDRAIATIDKLAELADDGEYYRKKALLLNETGEWEEVVESCRLALAKGGLGNPGEVWLLQGVALTELGRFGKAIDAFQNAKRSGKDSVRRDASTWIGYVEERSRGPS